MSTDNQTNAAEVQFQPTEAQLQQAMKMANRAQAMKRYGLLLANVVGQIALGAAGCALMLKVRDRAAKAANDTAVS